MMNCDHRQAQGAKIPVIRRLAEDVFSTQA